MQRLPNPASLTHDERMQHRANALFFACKGTEPETLDDGSAIYTADANGRFYLQVFEGKALRTCRAVSGYYRAADRRAAAIENFKQSRAQHHARQFQRRQEAKKPHTLKLGDVLYTSWGYEQTNINFYEVVAVSGVMVTVREIASSTVKATGDMSAMVTACPGQFIGEPLRRRPNASNWIRIHSAASAYPWNGRPQHATWYG